MLITMLGCHHDMSVGTNIQHQSPLQTKINQYIGLMMFPLDFRIKDEMYHSRILGMLKFNGRGLEASSIKY